MNFSISFCRNLFILSASTLRQQHRISSALSGISVGSTVANVGHRRNGVMYLIALIAIPSLSKQSYMVSYNLWKKLRKPRRKPLSSRGFIQYRKKKQEAKEEALELQRFYSISEKTQEAEKETLELQRFHSEFHSISKKKSGSRGGSPSDPWPGPLSALWPGTAHDMAMNSTAAGTILILAVVTSTVYT